MVFALSAIAAPLVGRYALIPPLANSFIYTLLNVSNKGTLFLI